MNGHRIIASCSGQIGGHWPELDGGFTKTPHVRIDLMPSILEEEAAKVHARCQAFLGEHLVMNPSDRLHFGTVLEEIIMNVTLHGLQARTFLLGEIEMAITCDLRRRYALVCRAFDEGDMFDLSKVPDCTLPENLMNITGRGLHIARTIGGFTISGPFSHGEGRGKELLFTRPVQLICRKKQHKFVLLPPEAEADGSSP